MQPDVFPSIANIDGTGIAKDTAHGTDLVLNNTLSRAIVNNTDTYMIRFANTCNLPASTKVSLEWKVYRDGVLINDNLSDYADFRILTKYDRLNQNGPCQTIGWIGGTVLNGFGECQPSTYNSQNCIGGYPGAMQVDQSSPLSYQDNYAPGYVVFGGEFMALDYFNLPFFEQTDNKIQITWKQVGNYSIVISLRERVGGTDWPTLYWNEDQNLSIGGHQSCCGGIIATDSIHYLVTTTHEKAICDGSTFDYGRPIATFSEENLYNVLFGTYDCEHWKVDSIDIFQLYTRINPEVIVKDTILCRADVFTSADLASLAQFDTIPAPGRISQQILWAEDPTGEFTSTVPSTANLTSVKGSKTFYVKQVNGYYDLLTADSIFYCNGIDKTITVTVNDLYAPIVDKTEFEYCHDAAEGTVQLTAALDENDLCSDVIRWFSGNNHSESKFLGEGTTFDVKLDSINSENVDDVVRYSAWAYRSSTGTYSEEGVPVVFTFHMNPVFVLDETQLDYVVCPGSEVTLESNIRSEEPTYNDGTNVHAPVVTYNWDSDAIKTSISDSDFTYNASMICNHVDSFTVTVVATSYYGCETTVSRKYNVLSQDTLHPEIAWIDSLNVLDNLGNRRDTILNGCDSSAVPAPYTLDQFKALASINDVCSNPDSLAVTDVAYYTPCQTVVNRTYVVYDACENASNPINDIFVIKNIAKPVLSGLVNIDPVRPFNNDCKDNAPDYATMRANFDTNITVNYACPQSTIDTVVFYLGNTNIVADGNEDIFAEVDVVTIYAVLTDSCGNVSEKTPVFLIHKPEEMYITHGSITLDTLELCADATTNMQFNDLLVHNADRPYSYQWSQISVNGQCVITPDSNDYLNTVVEPENKNINTSTHFVMTVTDVYGCVASDTSNAIHFYRLPDVTITDDYRNAGYPHHDGDTVCPNYGNFYVVANALSNLPDSIAEYQIVDYAWTGSVISSDPYTQGNFFKLACENCDTLYVPVVTVTNKKNCSATADYHIYGYDQYAPVVTAITEITLPLSTGNGCSIEIPDFVGNNLYFNAATVSDNCFRASEMTITQDITPGTLVNHDQLVTVTVATPCGPAATHTILVKMPSTTIAIDTIVSEQGCEPVYATLVPTIVNATGAVTYSWTIADSVFATTETADVVADFAAHTYVLNVEDEAGCADSRQYDVVVFRMPVETDFEFVNIPNSYCGDEIGDGVIGMNILNNDAHIVGYAMQGDDVQPYRALDYVYEDLKAGVYTFTVFTSDGCSKVFVDTLTTDTTDVNLLSLNAYKHLDNYKCVSRYSGSVNVVPNIENYVYQIFSDTHFTDGEEITSDATNITPIMFNYLYQDTYRVLVTTPKHCHFLTNDVVVANVTDTPSTHIVVIDSVSDCESSNGIIHVMGTNPDYVYTIGNQSMRPRFQNQVLDFTGLAAGDYTLHIVSSGDCDFDQNIHVGSILPVPNKPFVTLAPDQFCYGTGANGSITIPDSSVMAGYTYTIGGLSFVGNTTPVVFDALTADTYTMYIKGTNNCVSHYDFIIPSDPFVVTFAQGEVVATNGNNCLTPNNSIQISPVSGYTYQVIDEFGNVIAPARYDSLADGSYDVVKIHDVFSCDYDTTVTVGLVKPVYNFNITLNPDADCSALGTGSVVVADADQYTYSLYNFELQQLDTLTNLDAGQYVLVAVSNTTHCSYDTVINILSNTVTPVIDTIVTTPNINCIDVKTGTITMTLTDTLNGVYYAVDNDGYVYNNTNGEFSGLNSGVYNCYFVSDLHCASLAQEVEVEDSAFVDPIFTITPNHSCDSTLNMPGTGCIYVDAPHNNDIHGYAFNLTLPGAWTDHHIDIPSYKWCALSDNLYNIDIVDTITGCEYHGSVKVPFEEVHVVMDYVATENTNCVLPGNGTLKVTATSSNVDADLQFSIDGSNWYAPGTILSNLAGEYTIVVRDNYFNCLYDTLSNKDVKIDFNKKELLIDVATVNNNACDSNLYNGSITLNSVLYADSTAVDFTATLDTVVGTQWNGLGAGSYEINIHDNLTGCDSVISVDIKTETTCAPVITVTSTGYNKHGVYNFCLNDQNGYLHASAEGECDEEFSYEWNSSCAHAHSDSADVHVYTDEVFCCNYTVVATGLTTGCNQVQTIAVCVDTLPEIHFTASVPMASANPTATFRNCENVDLTFGIVDPGFDTIIWANGYVDTNVASFDVPAYQLTPGQTSYCVYVVDGNGCHAGYTAANVVTLPIARDTVAVDSCNTFSYTTQSGIVYNYTYREDTTNTYAIIDTFACANSCDSIVLYNVTINPNPSVVLNNANLLLNAYCHGDTLPSAFGFTASHADTAGLRITSSSTAPSGSQYLTDSEFVPTNALSRDMNGKYVYAFVANSCDTIYTALNQLIVDSLPTIAVLSGDTTYCTGSLIALKDSVIAWNSVAVGTTKMLVSPTNSALAGVEKSSLLFADDSSYVFFTATNACGTTTSNGVRIFVDTVKQATFNFNNAQTASYCVGDTIDIDAYTFVNNSSSDYDSAYLMLGAEKYVERALTMADSSKKFYYALFYACGETYSDSVAISVKDTANIAITVDPTNDTICMNALGTYTYHITRKPSNVLSVNVNNGATYTIGRGVTVDTVKVTVSKVGELDIAFTSTAANCGSKTLYDTVVVTNDSIEFTAFTIQPMCAGEKPVMPTVSYTDKSAGSVYSEEWQIAATKTGAYTEFDTSAAMSVSQNGYFVRYAVEMTCGTVYSDSIKITVNDTAHLVVTPNTYADSICVGDSLKFVATVHPTNVLSAVSLKGYSKVSVVDSIRRVDIQALTVGSDTVVVKSLDSCGLAKTDTITFVVCAPAEVDTLDDIDPVCEGEVLTVVAPAFDEGNSLYTSGWQTSSDGIAFVDFDATTPMTSSHNSKYIRYYVANHCDTSYSDTLRIVVNDTAKDIHVNIDTVVVCNGGNIDQVIFTCNKNLSLSDTLGLTFAKTDTGYTLNGVIAGHAAIDTITVTATTIDENCPTYNKTADIVFIVHDVPTVTATATPDTFCIGDTFNWTFEVEDNGSTVTEEGWYIIRAGVAAEWDGVIADSSYNGAKVYYAATNECGTSYSDSTKLKVAVPVSKFNSSVVLRDTCEGSPFVDFLVANPTFTRPTYTTIDTTFYEAYVSSQWVAIEDSTLMMNPSKIRFAVVTACQDTTYADTVDLGFDKLPTLSELNDELFKICDGGKFTMPAFTVTPAGSQVIDTLWTINGDTLYFDSTYDASYHNAEIVLTIVSACGNVSDTVNATVYTLPVPQMLKDTTVCESKDFTLSVVSPSPSSTYEWFTDNGTFVSDEATVTLNRTEGTYRFYVVETSVLTNCASTQRMNAAADSMMTNFVTVRVADAPAFVFKNAQGVQTHDIFTTLGNQTTSYSWQIDTMCSSADNKIYVEFAVFKDGVEIPVSELGTYLNTAVSTNNGISNSWYSQDMINYRPGSNNRDLTATSYYGNNESLHYPHTKFEANVDYDFGYLWLHFMVERPVYKQFAQFKVDGEYKVVYKLYSTTSDDDIQFYYYNNELGRAMTIGGGLYNIGTTLLSVDTLSIHVDATSEINNSQDFPDVEPVQVEADEAQVSLYPNPATSKVNVEVAGIEGATTIKVATLTGSVVFTQHVSPATKAANIYSLDVNDLVPGVYVIQVANSNAVISRKLVITK